MDSDDPRRRLSTWEFIGMVLLTTRVHDAIERFSKGRFSELVRMMSASKHRYHSATIDGIEVHGGTLAGRAMVTFKKGDVQVTVIGVEDNPERGCNLQSIDASADEARGMIDTAITGWDLSSFRQNPKATIVPNCERIVLTDDIRGVL